MQYRVEELAKAAGVSVDTLRFYQRRGLLARPMRRGRIGLYGASHLARLREIQRLARRGFKLEQIAKLLPPESQRSRPVRGAPRRASEQLLSALLEQGVGSRTYSRAELAALSGISEPILAIAERSGLLQPVRIDGRERFSESDLGMCRAALVIFSSGFPLQELLALSAEHARAVEATVDRAIAIFERHAREAGGAELDLPALLQRLLPEATRLVALHFHNTLVRRALERLRDVGDARALEEAFRSARAARLEVAWH